MFSFDDVIMEGIEHRVSTLIIISNLGIVSRQKSLNFADGILKRIFLDENV